MTRPRPQIVAPLVMFIFVVASCIATFAALSCSGANCADPKNGSSAACVAENALLECAGGDVVTAIDQYTPLVQQIIRHGLKPDGSIDYTSIEGDLITAVEKYGWCAVSSVFDHYIHPPTTGSGMKLAGPAPTSDAAKQTFDKLRAKVAPQLKVHVSSGATL